VTGFGEFDPIPGQPVLPGMPSQAKPADGQSPLPGLEFAADDSRAAGVMFPAGDDQVAGDQDLAAVAAGLSALDGDGARMAAAIRGALDMLLDGQHTRPPPVSEG